MKIFLRKCFNFLRTVFILNLSILQLMPRSLTWWEQVGGNSSAVEQMAVNHQVRGSNPCCPAKKLELHHAVWFKSTVFGRALWYGRVVLRRASTLYIGALVQLVRTLPCHGRGHGFESRTHRKLKLCHILKNNRRDSDTRFIIQ